VVDEMSVRLQVNGKEMAVPAETTMSGLLSRSGISEPLLIIHNGHPVPANRWGDSSPRDGDRIDIVTSQAPVDDPTFQALLSARNTPGLQDRFRNASVGIIGCGGLGSHTAIALARTGIGTLVLADPDRVDPTNLNRQCFDRADIGRPKVDALAAHIRAFNPFIRLVCHGIRISDENLADIFQLCSIVVEAVDGEPDKAMLVNRFSQSDLSDKTLVSASGMAGIADPNMIRTRRLSANIILCGDLETGACPGTGLMAPRVMIAAGHQATAVLRLLSGEPVN